jgi:exonuclease III
VKIATFNVNGVKGRLPRLLRAEVDAEHRGREKPSDHAPVWIELADAPSTPFLP